MDQTELENGTLEREALDADSRKVVELLSALPRVEAPGNFEFRVKAGIAVGERRTGLSPFLKAAVAMPLVLVVGTFALFYGTGDTPVTDIAGGGVTPVEQQRVEAAPASTVPAPTSPTGNTDRIDETDIAIAAPQSRGQAERRSTPVKRSIEVSSNSMTGGGSRVETVINPKVIDPPGINSNLGRQERNSNSADAPGNVSVREVLEMLGVKAEYVDGGWMVRSTTENSLAGRSGIRANDVIESVNNETVSGKTFLKGRLEGKTVKVRRDGKQIEIGLQD
jgi:hypothetical protein